MHSLPLERLLWNDRTFISDASRLQVAVSPNIEPRGWAEKVHTGTNTHSRLYKKKPFLLKKTRDGSLSLYSIHYVLYNVEDKYKQMVSFGVSLQSNSYIFTYAHEQCCCRRALHWSSFHTKWKKKKNITASMFMWTSLTYALLYN